MAAPHRVRPARHDVQLHLIAARRIVEATGLRHRHRLVGIPMHDQPRNLDGSGCLQQVEFVVLVLFDVVEDVCV